MKAKDLNISILDMSEAEDCTIDTSKLPSEEEFLKKVTEALEKLKKEGVTEVERINICIIDLSEAERISVK